MTTQEQVSVEAVDRFHHPRNFGPIDQCNGHARITGPCGDTMEIWLQVADGQIVKAGFTTDGCGPSRASGSMATELAIGKAIDETTCVEQSDILHALGGLPSESEHCALLAANTLQAAIRDSQQREQTAATPCGECSQTDYSSKPPQELNDEMRDQQALDQRMSQIRHTFLVMSGKGGVGKSTVAANLAISLASAGNRVGLLDVDIHGPSIPRLMGLDGDRLAVRGSELLPLDIGKNLRVMSIGFLLESDKAAVIWRGPMKHGIIQQFLTDVAWGPLDYLVIDAPPGTGDEPLSVAQLVGQNAGALLVTTPQDLAISDVRRSVSFCKQLSLRVIGIIENMSGMVCPHCAERIELFKTGGGELLAQEMNVPFLGNIPIDPAIVECGDSGTPYLQRFAQSQAAKAFNELVGRLVEA